MYRQNSTRTKTEPAGCGCCPHCRERLARLELWLFRYVAGAAALTLGLTAAAAARAFWGG